MTRDVNLIDSDGYTIGVMTLPSQTAGVPTSVQYNGTTYQVKTSIGQETYVQSIVSPVLVLTSSQVVDVPTKKYPKKV